MSRRGRGAGPETGAGSWLAVETGGPTGSVAVWRDALVYECSFRIQGTHSERLLPAIDEALRLTDTQPGDVSSFVIGAGPGSFTGVRIAASLAKGWAMARGAALYAYSSLLTAAAGSGIAGPVCALFDARRDEVYAACYDLSCETPAELLPPGAWPIDGLLAELSSRGIRPAAFAGDGVVRHRAALARGAVRLLPEHLGMPRAATLLWLRGSYPGLGAVRNPGTWEPAYVRDWRVEDGSV